MNRSVILVVVLSLGSAFVRIATADDAGQSDAAEIISKENSVDSLTPSAEWQPAAVGQKLAWHDRLRTGEDSRAAVRLGDLSILRLDELTEAEVLPPPAASAKPTVDLKQGTAYFFSREKSREINVQTPAANGGIRGTEFVVTVAANGSTTFTMIDGEVEISNADGLLVVRSGERADIEPGGKPAKNEVSNAINSAMWCFYYPGVLDPKEVMASMGDSDAVRASISAYSDGDLLMALQQYPRNQIPASPEEKVYRAALSLVSGQVAKAEDLLEELEVRDRQAISTLIAAVTLKDKKDAESPQTASEWLAESYYRQSQGDLAGARQAAERATTLDPNFGFAWTRVAEVELGMGRASQAKTALEKGISLAPRNPAAHALRGFILSADGKLSDARKSFERALDLDSALGDAWLGHGLCLIRQGHNKAGRRDLFTAAALEPNRAIFRTYLDKDFSDTAREATTQKGRAPRSKITADPGPYYPGLIPPPRMTAGPRPYYPRLIPRTRMTASPRPSSQKQSTRPERTPSPKPDSSGRDTRPRTTESPRPSQAKDTPPSKTTRGAKPQRLKGNPRPTPFARPPQGQQVRQPKPAQPARGAIVPGAPAARQQAKGRQKRPTTSQSPTPY